MNNQIKKITTIGIVAALYAALTLALGFISYGPIQFRVAEIMTLLPLFGKEYIIALTIGCFFANVIGPYGLPDIILGTLATFISVYLVYITGKKMKNSKLKVIVAAIWPIIINAVVIGGVMLHGLFKLPLFLSMLQVGFGQFVVIVIGGIPIFNIISNKYEKMFINAFK